MECVKLIPSGIQVGSSQGSTRNSGVLAANKICIAYAATLAIYILDVKTLTLKKVISNTSKPYTAIAWVDEETLVGATSDEKLSIWTSSGELLQEIALSFKALPFMLQSVENSAGKSLIVGFSDGSVQSLALTENLRSKPFQLLVSVDEGNLEVVRARGDKLLIG